MLIVSRKINESVIIQENIEIVLLDVQGDKAKIGINAPNDIKIMRSELLETEKANKEAADFQNKSELDKLKAMFRNAGKK